MDPAPEMKRTRVPSMNFEAEILTAPHDNSELYVIPSMRSLTAEEYVEAFKSFLDHSTEHQCMDEFNREEMPNIMAGLGDGKSTINVLGVGSGTGEQDLKMIRILQAAHPGVLIDNEIIEPNPQHVAAYKELVNQAPDLHNVSFIWHQLTSSEYEQQVKEKGTHKKFDFIHMIQMLYRVEDIHNTIKFFHSCLDHHGKLLIIILSGLLWTGWHLLRYRLIRSLASRGGKSGVSKETSKEEKQPLPAPALMDQGKKLAPRAGQEMLCSTARRRDGGKVFPSHVSFPWGETYELIAVTPSVFPSDS
ncbi:carnosine N-methyltransferase 2 isoform X2 [Chroicocephalus ridibundus]|uniref:carnosine N-methyltransferase 2 isoform X2 n=1 Tax=Chroicocephalus ridibundus TaxID=1192867 RepID=UPI002FDDB735